MRTVLIASALVLAATLAATTAYAQASRDNAGVSTALGEAPKSQEFVTMAAQGDLLEIESSKLALSKSDSDRTRQFANRMVKDHTATTSELRGLVSAGKVQATLPSGLDKAHQEKLAKLARLEGREFTKAYDSLQVSAHQQAVSLFERYSRDGDDAALKAFAAKHLPHLQEHLKMAQALGK